MKYCYLCNAILAENTNLFHYLFQNTKLCSTCLSQFHKQKKFHKIGNHKVYVLYTFTPLLHKIITQLNKQDTALLELLQNELRLLKKRYSTYSFFLPNSPKRKFYFLSYWLKQFNIVAKAEPNSIYFYLYLPNETEIKILSKNTIIIAFTNNPLVKHN